MLLGCRTARRRHKPCVYVGRLIERDTYARTIKLYNIVKISRDVKKKSGFMVLLKAPSQFRV